jgi:transposase InsO family protein
MKRLAVTIPELCQLHPALTDTSINNNVSYNRKKGNNCWQHYYDAKDNNRVNIYYDSIPAPIKAKYDLPAIEVAKDIVAEYRARHAEQLKAGTQSNRTEHANDLVGLLSYARTYSFFDHYNFIQDNYDLMSEKCQLFAKRIAVWQFIKDNYDGKCSAWQQAFDVVMPEDAKGNAPAFKTYLNSVCKAKDIVAFFVDNRTIKKAQKRISTFQYEFIKAQYVQPQKLGAKPIHSNLIAACRSMQERPYSLGSVKLYMREMERNIELYAMRYGSGQAQKKMPFATLIPAIHRNTQWQMDGWTMPFWGADFQRYTLYCIWDNHSRKVVGISIGERENTTMILAALEDAIRNTGVLPAELVSDKHSFTKTKVAKRFAAETEKMGMVWTVTTNAQRNQIAERYNRYFDPLSRELHGYTGQNVTAKGKDARPSDEHMQELRKTRHLLTKDEIIAIAAHLEVTYNKTPLEPLGGMTPNEKYDASTSVKAFAITEMLRNQLLKLNEAYKVSRGQITIKIGIIKHEFQLSSALASKYNGKEVDVTYEDLEQGIYLFDVKTGGFIADVAPKPKIHGAIPDQTEADIRLLNQQAGRTNGTVTKARKREITDLSKAFAANPEAIALINHYSIPKDIRAQAMQDNEIRNRMRDLGGNESMLLARNLAQLANTTQAAPKKTKESPFTPVNNVMKKISGVNIRAEQPE